MSRKEVTMAGFGGQGIIMAGFILGKAAIFGKENSTFTRDYGPEARGGSCRADVVISDEAISYPYVEDPAVVVVMSQEAYTRYASGLKKEVTLIIDEELVKLDGNAGHPHSGKVFAIPATRMAQELGRSAVANIVMLGFLSAVTNVVPVEAMKKAVLDSVPKGTEELNTKAFDRGHAHGLEQLAAGGKVK